MLQCSQPSGCAFRSRQSAPDETTHSRNYRKSLATLQIRRIFLVIRASSAMEMDSILRHVPLEYGPYCVGSEESGPISYVRMVGATDIAG